MPVIKQRGTNEDCAKTLASTVNKLAEDANTSFIEEKSVKDRRPPKQGEYAPSEEELKAYRNGEEWDPVKAKELALQKEKIKLEEIEESKKTKVEVEPTSNYAAKYEKLLGRDAGIAAAKIATPNKQFGFVPSEQKKDQRSIEQTLADIQAKKKLKKTHDVVEGANTNDVSFLGFKTYSSKGRSQKLILKCPSDFIKVPVWFE
ncbi:hypothetical protein AVEN_257399-1 [Araneus ventricosus]|uniref:Sperm-associated antigen 7 n=1 Tax=Araneus ventricosus TaxID=182803 RepID=A0A4Y2TK83_ARAVE|nr:hypothetical protein AVEN_257399-1 [Araneus ventricosus]